MLSLVGRWYRLSLSQRRCKDQITNYRPDKADFPVSSCPYLNVAETLVARHPHRHRDTSLEPRGPQYWLGPHGFGHLSPPFRPL